MLPQPGHEEGLSPCNSLAGEYRCAERRMAVSGNKVGVQLIAIFVIISSYKWGRLHDA